MTTRAHKTGLDTAAEAARCAWVQEIETIAFGALVFSHATCENAASG